MMDVQFVLSYGCIALISLAAAALLWRRGASLSPLPDLFSARKGAGMWADGLLISFCFQATPPGALASLGMNLHGIRGAALLAVGASAGILIPLAYFIPLLPAALLALAGLILFCAPFGARSFARALSCFLLSFSALCVFSRYGENALRAAFISQYPAQEPDILVSVLYLVLGVCFCYLFRGEGFALIAPLSPLSAGVISVQSYLYYACGVFIGSFLCVLVHSWEWRKAMPGLLNRICVHRVLTSLLCLAAMYFKDDLPFTDSALHLAVLTALMPFASSLLLLPFCFRDPEVQVQSSLKPSFCHPLFRSLPHVYFTGMKAECSRLLTMNRSLFVAAAESHLDPKSANAASVGKKITSAQAYEKRFLNALDGAARETPGYIDPACLMASRQAAAGIRSMRMASERLADPPWEPDGASLKYLAKLEASTLSDIDRSLALFTEKSGVFGAEPAKPFSPPKSDPFAAMAVEICRSVSDGALLAGTSLEKLSGYPDPQS